EVIQATEPYALWKALGEKEKAGEFSEFFKEFWELENRIEYFPYGSKLADPFQDGKKPSYTIEKQQAIKNSPNFYQQAPFLTIAEDLLKLIKEDKIEQIIFLSAYDKKV
ncbi:3781_t:CDS:1, partial [Funneliformis geosporum]